jgi:outer membrane protein TolC
MTMVRSIQAAVVALAVAAGGMPAVAQSGDTLALDLAGAVARALRVADEARLASLGIDAAAAQLTSARASIFPQITFNGSYSQVVRNARATIVGNVFGQSYNYGANLNISQTIFQGGREFYALKGASRARQAVELDATEVRATLQVDVQRAYLNALFATRIAGIQRNGLTLSRDRLAQVEQLASSGRAARYDVLRARVEMTNLEPVVLDADNDRLIAELDLRRLLNIPVTQPLRLTTDLDAQSVQSVVTLVAEHAGDEPPLRPTLRAARLTYEARRAAMGSARADFLPTITVFLRTGFLALPGAPGFPWGVGRTSSALCPAGSPDTRVCQNDGWFRDESFGLQMSWPLFDGLRAKGTLDLATAQARIAETQLRQREELVALEVSRARAEFARARAAFDAQRTNAGEATEAFQLASLRFSRGIGTQLEVSDAQFALLTAQSNEARTVYDVHLAAAELARALGKPVPLPGSVPAARTTSSGQ